VVALLAAAVLAQVPADGAAVLTLGRTGVSPERALEVASDVEAVLREGHLSIAVSSGVAAQRVSGLPNCGGKRECAGKLAAAAGARFAVALYAAQVLNDLALHLELISADGELLSQDDVIVPAAAREPALRAPLQKFVELAATGIARWQSAQPSPSHAAADAPRLAPAIHPEAPPTLVSTAQARSARPLWVWAPGVAGVVAAGAGIYFLAQAQSAADQLRATPSTLSLAQATALRDQGVQNRTLGLVAAGAGAAGIAASGILFGTWSSPSESARLQISPAPGGWGLAVSGSLR
jgi:hypothetical protein